MTTSVQVWPHPGDGLRVEVTLTNRLSTGEHSDVTVLHKGQDPRMFYVSDNVSIKVAEVPDTPMEAVANPGDGSQVDLKG